MEIISISYSDKSVKLHALLTDINNMQYLLTCIDYIFKEQIIYISVAREVPIRGLVIVLITHTFTKYGNRVDSTHALWDLLSVLCPKASYPDCGVSWFSLYCAGRCHDIHKIKP